MNHTDDTLTHIIHLLQLSLVANNWCDVLRTKCSTLKSVFSVSDKMAKKNRALDWNLLLNEIELHKVKYVQVIVCYVCSIKNESNWPLTIHSNAYVNRWGFGWEFFRLWLTGLTLRHHSNPKDYSSSTTLARQ